MDPKGPREKKWLSELLSSPTTMLAYSVTSGVPFVILIGLLEMYRGKPLGR